MPAALETYPLHWLEITLTASKPIPVFMRPSKLGSRHFFKTQFYLLSPVIT